MFRVLFLCTGNTCRSPLAEAFARSELAGRGFRFDSAGLQVSGRCAASEGSLRAAESRGLDLRDHLSKPVSQDLLEDAAWIIGMTRSHAAIFRSRFQGHHRARIGVLGAPGVDLSGGQATPPCEEVDDPYGQSEESYEAAADQILRLVKEWGAVLKAPAD